MLVNKRLPDQLDVAYGPQAIISRFILQGDREARERGITLSLEHDFDSRRASRGYRGPSPTAAGTLILPSAWSNRYWSRKALWRAMATPGSRKESIGSIRSEGTCSTFA